MKMDALQQRIDRAKELSNKQKASMLEMLEEKFGPMQARNKRTLQSFILGKINQLPPSMLNSEQKESTIAAIKRTIKAGDEKNIGAVLRAVKDRILADQGISEEVRLSLTDKLRLQFESNQVQEPYFPLSRFGKYWAAAKEPVLDEQGNKTEELTLVEFIKDPSPAVIDNWAKAMRAKGFVVEKGQQVEEGIKDNSVDPAFAARVTSMVADKTGRNELADDIWQLYLRTLPEMSARKHFIHRKKIPGYSGDAIKAFSHLMFHDSKQLSRLRWGDVMQAELTELKIEAEQIGREGGENWELAMPLYEVVKRRHDWAMNPKSAAWSNRLTSLGFVMYLGITPAAAMVNMTQTPIMGIPVLGARHGVARASAELSKGIAQATRWGGIEGALKGNELKAYQELMRRGVIDKTQAHDLAGIAESGAEYSPKMHRVMTVISYLFHRAEVWNREATAIAAYRLAIKDGMSHEAAVDHANDMTWTIHFNYGNTNRPDLMQGDWLKVITLFKQYSLNITYRLLRDFNDSFRSESPEVRSIARKQLVGILGMTTLFGGVSALPMYWAVMMMANALMDWDEEEDGDAETAMRAYIAQQWNPAVSQAIFQGPIEAATGASISSRVSLNNLWLRDQEVGDTEDKTIHYIMELLGPVVKLLPSAGRAADRFTDEPSLRAFEPILPKFLKDSAKAYRFMAEGATNLSGDEIVETELHDSVIQFLGFVPAHLTMQYEQNNALKKAERKVTERRSRIINKMRMSIFRENKATQAGDQKAKEEAAALRNEAAKEIRAFNEKYPTWPITKDGMETSVKAYYRARSRMKGGVIINPRLDYLYDKLRFVDPPKDTDTRQQRQ